MQAYGQKYGRLVGRVLLPAAAGVAMKLVTASQMRELEAAAFAAGATPEGLMETAGRLVAEAVADRLGNARAKRVIVMAGPGNNGGDGLVAARYLHDMTADVRVYLLAPRTSADPNYAALVEREVDLIELDAGLTETQLPSEALHADAIIDAVLGIGRGRPFDEHYAAALGALRQHRGVLFAVDVPSGLDADTGEVDQFTPHADVTLTFGYSKLGLHLLPGAEYAGEVQVLDIGLDPALGQGIQTEIMTATWARGALPERPLISNKGSFGRVMVVAGSMSYTGAATLACLGALRAGAGLVTLAALPAVRAAVAAQVPEVTFVALPESGGEPDSGAAQAVAGSISGYDVVLIGPGLGQSQGAKALVRGVLAAQATAEIPLVIDADALNTLAQDRDSHADLRRNAVLTPHPGEFARLTGASVADVQAHRLDSARRAAAEWRQTLVLKGAETVVAASDGRVLLSPFANAALATAGTGDVLAGAIAALLAQGEDAFSAAGLGVYLHGDAAELYAAEYGPSGLLASEVAAGIARSAARLRRGA